MKQKIAFIICLLFGLMFINAGLNKFFNYLPVPPDLPRELKEMDAAMAKIGWLLPLVATAEVLGGIFFIIPRTRALGALIIFPVMIGIMLVHLTVAPEGLPMALILLIICIWTLVVNREKYFRLVK